MTTLGQHIFQRAPLKPAGGRGTIIKFTENNAGHVIQVAAQPQLRQHPVNAIDMFIHILQEQDRPFEIGQVRSTNKMGKH